MSPSKSKKLPKVILLDLCALCMVNKDRIKEIKNYWSESELLASSFSSDAEEGNVIGTGSTNNDNNNDDNIGPIFKSWALRLLSSKDFIKSGTNFTIAELCLLWNNLQHIIKSKWNVGSGKKSSIHLMNALLICLVQLKQGATYDIVLKAFGCNSMKMH